MPDFATPRSKNVRRVAGEVLHRLPASWHEVLPQDVRYRVRRRLGRGPWDTVNREMPVPGPGESTGPPDFIGIGVQKAGTTRWLQLIMSHPQVVSYAADRKELHYLSRYGASPFGSPEIEGYHRWFPKPAGQLAGEWTPDYLYLPWVAEIAHRAAPDARLLLCLRDPVERFCSGLPLSRLTIRGHSSVVETDAIAQGFYMQCLTRWLEYFPREQMLVLQHERNVREGAAELRRTYEFLGVDPSYVPPEMDTVYGESSAKVTLEPDTVRRLTALYTPDVKALVAAFPEIDLSLWKNFSGLA